MDGRLKVLLRPVHEATETREDKRHDNAKTRIFLDVCGLTAGRWKTN